MLKAGRRKQKAALVRERPLYLVAESRFERETSWL